jgi:hypothetical protein
MLRLSAAQPYNFGMGATATEIFLADVTNVNGANLKGAIVQLRNLFAAAALLSASLAARADTIIFSYDYPGNASFTYDSPVLIVTDTDFNPPICSVD